MDLDFSKLVEQEARLHDGDCCDQDDLASVARIREPYVGEGADGARRSAEIDREEVDTLDPVHDSERIVRALESAARWDAQAVRLVSAPPEARLYGTPGSETLWDDIAAAYEQQIEPWADEQDRRPLTIEEWTVHPPIYHLPSAARLIEWVTEVVADEGMVTEGFTEEIDKFETDPELLAAAEQLRETIAAKIRHRMADERVGVHTISWDDNGQPLVNGDPLYQPSC